MRNVLAAGLVLASMAFASNAHAHTPATNAYAAAFGPCRGETCIIRDSPGGNVMVFLAAAAEVINTGRRVVIDGPCHSACAIFADMARERVCITKRALFGFHKATLLRAERSSRGERRWRRIARHDPVHSDDIANWVYRHGGFPARGARVMSYRDASRFWPTCRLARG
jgi:hypothetical protein